MQVFSKTREFFVQRIYFSGSFFQVQFEFLEIALLLEKLNLCFKDGFYGATEFFLELLVQIEPVNNPFQLFRIKILVQIFCESCLKARDLVHEYGYGFSLVPAKV